MKELGEIKKVNIREIWPNEEKDFTPWLAKNIEKLGQVIGIELELISTEADVGDFNLDILAKDTARNRFVVIENQYGNTDHKHLGQLLTYAAGYDSGTIIWISEEIREEHRKLLDWLNENTVDEVEFYGVVVEVLQIDNSKPAFNFKLIAYPNEWSKSSISTTKSSAKMELYKKYFQELIDILRTKYSFTEGKKGQPQSWYSFTTGIKGILYSASFAQGNKVRVEVYIDTGDFDNNKNIFDKLYQIKDLFENDYGEELEWERLDDRRACRIAIYRKGCIEDQQLLEEIKKWSIEKLLKFKKVITTNNEINKILKG